MVPEAHACACASHLVRFRARLRRVLALTRMRELGKRLVPIAGHGSMLASRFVHVHVDCTRCFYEDLQKPPYARTSILTHELYTQHPPLRCIPSFPVLAFSSEDCFRPVSPTPRKTARHGIAVLPQLDSARTSDFEKRWDWSPRVRLRDYCLFAARFEILPRK